MSVLEKYRYRKVQDYEQNYIPEHSVLGRFYSKPFSPSPHHYLLNQSAQESEKSRDLAVGHMTCSTKSLWFWHFGGRQIYFSYFNVTLISEIKIVSVFELYFFLKLAVVLGVYSCESSCRCLSSLVSTVQMAHLVSCLPVALLS